MLSHSATHMSTKVACLCAADLGGGGILHEVVEGHAAKAAQPGLQVLHAHLAVVAQARLRTGALGNCQQVALAHADVRARLADLDRSHKQIRNGA